MTELMTESPKLYTPGPMKPEQVQSLVFEGGGGKGFAYLGALQALEDPRIGILKYSQHPRTKLPVLTPGDSIKSIGGSSAGAITALLLSCGYRSTEIHEFMESNKFHRFFDPALPRKVPGPFDAGVDKPRGLGALSARRCEESVPQDAVSSERISQIIQKLLGYDWWWARWLRGHINPAFVALIKEWPAYLMYLWDDMGFFSGCNAREIFARELASRLPRGPSGELQYHATFEDHWKHFGIQLGVTGTNLETGKSQLFSFPRTPDFPVADAIRISMGVPLAWKPYVIRSGPHKGVWVDGGLVNNAPFYEFESQAKDHPATLALRLEIEKDEEIQNFFDLFARWFKTGFLGAGEAHINESLISQTILLDTKGLGLFDLAPDPSELNMAINAARSKTYEYFGLKS